MCPRQMLEFKNSTLTYNQNLYQLKKYFKGIINIKIFDEVLNFYKLEKI